MAEKMICRHCGRPIAVPAARCPWPGCGKTIMVVCAACKQYTDDEGSFCQQCGEPLVAATFDPTSGPELAQSLVAELAADQEKARLVASGVIAAYTTGFFYEGEWQRPALIKLFGSPLSPQREVEALLFAAVAYLVQQGYVALSWVGGGPTAEALCLAGQKPWDGQERSLEGLLALRARSGMTCLEALQQVVAEAVGLRIEICQVDEDGYVWDRTEADLAVLPVLKARLEVKRSRGSLANWVLSDSYRYTTQIRARFDSAPLTGLLERAWQTVLPPHQEAAACRETYQMLLDFARGDPKRAEALALAVERVMRWFVRCEQHPELVTHDL
jgi:hypothetical protein